METDRRIREAHSCALCRRDSAGRIARATRAVGGSFTVLLLAPTNVRVQGIPHRARQSPRSHPRSFLPSLSRRQVVEGCNVHTRDAPGAPYVVTHAQM